MQKRRALSLFAAVLLTATCVASAQTLYKYRGENGEWMYSDKPPPDPQAVDEVRNLVTGSRRGRVTVETRAVGGQLEFIARNQFHAPVEVALRFKKLASIQYPNPDADLVWVLPAQGSETLLSLDILATGGAPVAEYEYEYMVGRPNVRHQPDALYRVPVAIATDYPITQAYPDTITHRTKDSFHAVDIAMPIGTDIFAARGGIVFDVSSDNYKGGTDPEQHGNAANVVQILHDDGTFAIYAHLNWNSIRVRPGDRVVRGQFIAESGNTGFTTGPHLHFAVVRNTGLELESVPVRFEGADSRAVVPSTGNALTAY